MTMEITRITSKGQVVIPQDIREGNMIKPGERFIVYDLEDTIVLKRIKNLEAAKTIDEFERVFRSTWETAKKRRITDGDVEAEIAAYRKETSKP